MNRIFRLVWSSRLNKLVAVSEATRGRGKSGGKSATCGAVVDAAHAAPGIGGVSGFHLSSLVAGTAVALVSGVACAQSVPVNTLPSGAQVSAGQASVASVGNAMTVQQGTQRAAINWQNFSVGRDASVQFVQPNAQAVMLNRVVGTERSVIDGALNANGQVWLLNANGLLFGKDAQVNVGGLVASTLAISDADFMAGRNTLQGTGSGSVLNLGTIKAADGGYVALLGQHVANEGVISARLGTAAMAAGDRISLNFNGNSLVGVTVEQGVLNALVANKQAVVADGGLVVLTARGLDTVLANVVNNTGEVRAQTVENRDGKIYLLGGGAQDQITVGGKLDASAPAGSNGGFVETSAPKVNLASDLTVTTRAAAGTSGRTGTWLIDPNDYTVAATGGDITGTALGTALASNNVTIASANGAVSGTGLVKINDNVSWSSGNTLTLSAYGNIAINKVIDASGGSGGRLVLQYGQGASAAGNAATVGYAMGTDGTFLGKVKLQAGQNFSTKLGSDGTTRNYTVVTRLGSAGDENLLSATNSLQGLGHVERTIGYFALGADIDASATSTWNNGVGFTPLGGPYWWEGHFNGLGNTITNLTINQAGSSAPLQWSGLFGAMLGGSLSNLALVNPEVNGANNVGSAVGWLRGSTVSDVHATNVLASGSANYVGGLVGVMDPNTASGIVLSTVTRSHATGLVSGQSGVGGLVGAGSLARISQSFATAEVQGYGDAIGGLVGMLVGSSALSDVASFGAVVNPENGANYMGGLVGYAEGPSATIDRAYSTALVNPGTAANRVWGGLLAYNALVTVSNSFWNTATSGATDSAGGTAKVTADLQKPSTFQTAGWNMVARGNQGPNYTTPIWSSESSAAQWEAFQTPINVTINALSRNYGDANPSLTGLWTESGSSLISSLAWGSAASQTRAAGTVSLSAANVLVPTLTSGSAIDYMVNAGNATLTINPKPISISGTTVAGRTYDGTTAATFTPGTITGLVGSETLNVSVNGSFVSANAGTQSANGNYVLASGTNGGLASNYTLTTPSVSGLTATISQKPVTVSGLSAVGRSYDGTTAATFTGASLSGLVGSETLGLSIGGNFASSAAGSTTATANVALSNGTGLASNYALTNPTITGLAATITPRTLTMTGTSVASRNYDGTTNATITLGTLSGTVGAEAFAVTASGSFDSPNAGNRSVAVSYALGSGVGGAVASNYTLAGTTLNATISPKPLSITGASVTDRAYDGTNTLALVPGSLSGLVGSQTLGVTATGVMPSANVGTQSVTVNYTLSNGSNGGLASNYSLASTLGLSATITPRPVTLSGLTATNRTYDGSFDANLQGGTLTGLVGSETLGVSVSGTFASNQAGNTTASGTAALSNGTGLASNYALTNANFSGLAATIAPRPLSISGTSVANRVYDGTTTATVTTGSLQGLVGAEQLNVGTSGSFDSANAGNRTATVAYTLGNGTGGIASNYTLANTTHSATITPKPLSITGASVSDRSYDGTNTLALVAGSLSGLVGNETLGVSATGVMPTANVGTHAVTANYTLSNGSNGGLASNYSLASTLGLSATITPRTVTLSGLTATNRTYDGSFDANLQGGTLSGLVANETLAVNVTGTFASNQAGNTTASGTATLGNGSGLASNYTLSNPSFSGLAATIAPRPLSISGTSVANRVYDGTTSATVTAGSLQGLVGAEQLTVGASGSFDSANAGSRTATVAYTLGNGTGGIASNYSLANTTHSATIAPKPLSITGASVSDRTYDGTNTLALVAGSLSGLVGNETLGVSATGVMPTANVGTHAVTANYTLSNGSNGGLASNYSLASTLGLSATITPRTVTLSGLTATNRTYDGSFDANLQGGTLAGLVANETLAVNVTGTFASNQAGNTTASGTATLGNGSGLALNYTLSNPSFSGLAATIAPRPLSISGTSVANRVYDGTTTATVTAGSLQGLVGAEQLTVGASGSFDSANAGSRTATVAYTLGNGTGGIASNYTLANTTHSATITPKPLSITSPSISNRPYDGTNTLTLVAGSLSGMVGEETVSVTATGVMPTPHAGTHPVTVNYALNNGSNGGLAANYSLAPTPDLSVTITPRPVTLSGLTATDRVYDGTFSANLQGGTLSGLVGQETLAVNVTGTFASNQAGNTTASGAASLGDGTGLASNYTLTNPSFNGLPATIAARPLSIAGTSVADRVYDGTNQVQIALGTLSNLVGNEQLTVNASGSFDSPNAGTRAATIAYTLGNGAGAGLASNYTLANTTHQARISPKPLTISGTTASGRDYDGTSSISVTAGSLSGLLGQQTLGLVATGVADSANAGLRSVTANYALTDGGNGGLAANYSLAPTTGLSVTIAPKPVSINGTTAATRPYDGSFVASFVPGSITGLVGQETLGVSFSGSYASNQAGATTASGVQALIDGSNGGLASNYALSNPTLTGLAATITPRVLTANTTIASRVYDATTVVQITPGSLSGLVGSEQLGLTASGALPTPDAGQRTVPVQYTLTDGANGGLVRNYRIDDIGVGVTILPKPLSITGTLVADKPYDGTTVATVTPGVLSGFVGSQTVSVAAATGQFERATPGTHAVTASYTLANGSNGGLASNYSLANTMHTASIIGGSSPADLARQQVIVVDAAGRQSSSSLLNLVEQLAQALGMSLSSNSVAGVTEAAPTVSAQAISTVVNALAQLPADTPVAFTAAPGASELSVPITVAAMRDILTGRSGVPGAPIVIKIPASRGSFLMAVDGGIRLPQGMEQQVFVSPQ